MTTKKKLIKRIMAFMPEATCTQSDIVTSCHSHLANYISLEPAGQRHSYFLWCGTMPMFRKRDHLIYNYGTRVWSGRYLDEPAKLRNFTWELANREVDDLMDVVQNEGLIEFLKTPISMSEFLERHIKILKDDSNSVVALTDLAYIRFLLEDYSGFVKSAKNVLNLETASSNQNCLIVKDLKWMLEQHSVGLAGDAAILDHIHTIENEMASMFLKVDS